MKFRSLMTAICVLATANIAVAAPFAYVANSGTKTVSVIDTATNSVVGTPIVLPDGYPYGVAVGASGQYAYVGIQDANEVAVIDTARKVVVKRIGLGSDKPGGLAVNAAETRLYVASNQSNTLIVIDISYMPAPVELTRVILATEALSSPEGVVLSPAGDKAYVANSATGTVAEVSLDEANNVYTRTALIPVGSKPMGLAITSTEIPPTPPGSGYKLYVADLFGAAQVVNTKTRVPTSLPVGGGNVSVAIRPDNSKIYAPSYSLDKVYEISGTTDLVSATKYDVASAPFGSTVAPNNKLYLTMNVSDNVQVLDTTTNTLGTPIPLAAGAKPTSMGNFVGPVSPYIYTINATDDGTNCTILPVGAGLPANSYGRSFTIVTNSGTCDVIVDGASVGQPSVFRFSGITGNHTIDARPPVTGTFYTLSGNWITSVQGSLESTPFGINFDSRSAKFPADSTVTIKARSGFQVKTGTWTGACAGTVGATCSILMSADKSFGITTVVESGGATGPVKNITKGTFHQTVDEAITAAATSDEVRVVDNYSPAVKSVTTAGAAAIVTVSCGWSADFTAKTVPATPEYRLGTVTITGPGLIVDNMII